VTPAPGPTPAAVTPAPTATSAPATAAQTPAPAAAKPAPAAAVSAAPAAKPSTSATTTPSPKPAAASAKSEGTGGSDSKSGTPAAGGSEGSGEGLQFHPGVTFGTLTVDGKTWTRLAFTPEVSIGKLGVGFNVELFMDQDQNLATKGWDFDTKRNTVESILRKFDYVRWDHPGAPFYARFGTLQGIQLGYGLVASDYGNMALYPDYKELGLDVQFNDLTGLGIDLEGIVNNVQDVQNGGPFTAAKVGIRPLKPLGIPVLGGLAVRVGAAYDWNQYAGLRDQDGDGCPDAVDYAPTNSSVCVQPIDIRDLPGLDTSKSTGYSLHRADSADKANADATRSKYAMRKPFGVLWAEGSLPLVTTDFFGLELHTAIAKPKTQDPEAAAAGWGAIPLGASSHIGPITLTAEYRYFNQPFQPGYFDALYEIQRAQFVGDRVVTKELEIYGKDVVQTGTMQGYFAAAGWDVFGFLHLNGDYSDLFPSKSGEDELRAMGGKIGIGPQVTSILQNKIALAEVYWKKDRIGLDKWTDSTGAAAVERHDAFFANSAYTVYGYRVGSQVAGGLTLIIDRQTSFVRDDQTHKLRKENQMRIETQLKF
jgi:hypothetical protein